MFRKCHGNPELIPKNCVATSGKELGLTMGYWWDTSNPQPGMYTVEVTSGPQFCQQKKLENMMEEGRKKEPRPAAVDARKVFPRPRQRKGMRRRGQHRLEEQIILVQ